jgi:RNA polymerase-binding transcription factor DksA
MNQYSITDLSGFRLKLMIKLEETITKYQDIIRKLNDISRQENRRSYSVAGHQRPIQSTEREKLNTRANRLRKYLYCITNALLRIENGTYIIGQVKKNIVTEES